MFGYAFSEKKFANFNEELVKRPTYLKMRESGIKFTDFGDVTTREEAFMSNIAERLPVIGRFVRASDRAYTGFLNNLRADVFDTIYKGLKPADQESQKIVQDIGSFINAATGRGSFEDAFTLPEKLGGKATAELGAKINQSAPLLNTMLFAPRLIASRLSMLNPFYYKKLSGPARTEALKSAGGTVVAGMSILGLAKLAGAEVGTDWRSADFGKIKFGNGTRYDIWGGFQQYAVLIARMITNRTVSSTSGEERSLDEGPFASGRTGIGIRFLRSKLAPVPSALWDIGEKKNIVGEPTTPTSLLKNSLEPFILGDLEDTIKTYGALGPIISIPGIFGVGSQTYNSKTDTKSKKKSSGGLGTRVL